MRLLDSGLPTVRIREVVACTGLAAATIRKYEALGFVLPHVDRKGGHRLYSQEDIQWLQRLVDHMKVRRLTPRQISWALAELPALEAREAAGLGACGVKRKPGLPCWAVNLANQEWRRRCRACPGLAVREGVLTEPVVPEVDLTPLEAAVVALAACETREDLAWAAFMALGDQTAAFVTLSSNYGGAAFHVQFPPAAAPAPGQIEPRPSTTVLLAHGKTAVGTLTVGFRNAETARRNEPLLKLVARLVALQIVETTKKERTWAAAQAAESQIALIGYEARSRLSALALQIDVAEKHAVADAHGRRVRDALAKAKQSLRLLGQQLDVLGDTPRKGLRGLPLEVTQGDLAVMLDETCRGLASLAKSYGKSIKVVQRTPLVGLWDHVRIENAFSLLVRWVIKFTPGRAVEVAFSQRQGRARISVSPFSLSFAHANDHQLTINDTDVMGAHSLMMALDLARRVAEAHGGTLVVEFNRRSLRSFVVELPVGAASALPQPALTR